MRGQQKIFFSGKEKKKLVRKYSQKKSGLDGGDMEGEAKVLTDKTFSKKSEQKRPNEKSPNMKGPSKKFQAKTTDGKSHKLKKIFSVLSTILSTRLNRAIAFVYIAFGEIPGMAALYKSRVLAS